MAQKTKIVGVIVLGNVDVVQRSDEPPAPDLKPQIKIPENWTQHRISSINEPPGKHDR